MIEIQNITNDPYQRHVLLTADGNVELFLRFYPRAQFWTLSVAYNGRERHGVKLSLGTLHLQSANYPFDFVVGDSGATGIDPFTVDDFVSGRCRLFMLERADMDGIRGQPTAL